MSFLGFVADVFSPSEVTPEQTPPPPPRVPKPTLDEAIALLKRCVQETHFSPLYYGDGDLYRDIWNFLARPT